MMTLFQSLAPMKLTITAKISISSMSKGARLLNPVGSQPYSKLKHSKLLDLTSSCMLHHELAHCCQR